MKNRCIENASPLLFTIFTPTYNRADTLERLFQSIARQSRRNFEWLIVDDGSVDQTPQILQDFVSRADFPVRYVRQPNSGKHIAFNRGVREAHGTLFLTIDSDDELTNDALAVLEDAWWDIPSTERDVFTGVTARCIDDDGMLVGGPCQPAILDSDSADATLVRKMMGERIGFHRVDVLRAHPFPETLPTRFIPEGRIWLDIARHYKTRFIEAAARIFHDHDAPRLSNLDRAQRAWGDFEYNRFCLVHYASWWRIAPVAVAKFAIGLRRAELHLGLSADRTPFPFLARIFASCAWPIAVLAYARDLRIHRAGLGHRLLIARFLLRGRSGLRIARIFGNLNRRHDLPASVAVHANGVIAVLDPRNPVNDELLFSPRTVKPGLTRLLGEAKARTGKAAFVGKNITYAVLQAAHILPAGADIVAIEADDAQSERTRIAIRASYVDRVRIVAGSADLAMDELRTSDVIYFGDTESALQRMEILQAPSLPARLIVEVAPGATDKLGRFASTLTERGYRETPPPCVSFRVFEHVPEDPTHAGSA